MIRKICPHDRRSRDPGQRGTKAAPLPPEQTEVVESAIFPVLRASTADTGLVSCLLPPRLKDHPENPRMNASRWKGAPCPGYSSIQDNFNYNIYLSPAVSRVTLSRCHLRTI